MKKRVFAVLASLCMVVSMLPTMAFANGGESEPQEQCSCTVLCTEDSKNADCPVCSAAGGDLSACRGTAPEEEP